MKNKIVGLLSLGVLFSTGDSGFHTVEGLSTSVLTPLEPLRLPAHIKSVDPLTNLLADLWCSMTKSEQKASSETILIESRDLGSDVRESVVFLSRFVPQSTFSDIEFNDIKGMILSHNVPVYSFIKYDITVHDPKTANLEELLSPVLNTACAFDKEKSTTKIMQEDDFLELTALLGSFSSFTLSVSSLNTNTNRSSIPNGDLFLAERDSSHGATAHHVVVLEAPTKTPKDIKVQKIIRLHLEYDPTVNQDWIEDIIEDIKALLCKQSFFVVAYPISGDRGQNPLAFPPHVSIDQTSNSFFCHTA